MKCKNDVCKCTGPDAETKGGCCSDSCCDTKKSEGKCACGHSDCK